MAKEEDDAKGSRSDPETRKASLLLSGLVLTPDSGLEVFRDRRLADATLDLEHLRRARDILDVLGEAITTCEPARWAQVAQAWQALRQGQGPPTAELIPPPTDPLAGAGIDVAALNRVKLDGDEAKTLPADGLNVAADALPFTGARAKPPPPALDVEPDGDPLRATMGLDGAPLGEESALPFHKVPAASPSGASGSSTEEGEDDELLSMTDEAPTGRRPLADDEVTKAIVLPLETPSDAGAELPKHLVELTVEQYAALCAECAARPEWVDEIHTRYQVSDAAQRGALDHLWKERMAADSEVERTWRWHYERYQEWAKGR
ncbi:MAG: hypothetical protein JRI68_13940 [Deltaproteobacteria bacterium]|nr:hypothetical protein [Deltaproteobacteria bacterium]